jgi:hypothetical protein
VIFLAFANSCTLITLFFCDELATDLPLHLFHLTKKRLSGRACGNNKEWGHGGLGDHNFPFLVRRGNGHHFLSNLGRGTVEDYPVPGHCVATSSNHYLI